MNRHRSFLSLAGSLVLAVSSAACGGAAPRPTLPRAEAAALEFAPADAYFAARVDVERLRAQPTWTQIAARVAQDEPDLARTLERLDRVYVVVGGLVAAPHRASLTEAEDESVPRPAWYPLSQALGGRIPNAVAILDGASAVELCTTLMQAGEAREVAGHRVAVTNGVAITVEASRRCIVTFEPSLEMLFAQRGAPLSPALARLASLGRNEDLGLASAAIDLDAPAFEALVAAIRPGDGADENAQRWARVARNVFSILTQGIGSIEWVARTHPGGYRSEASLVATDADRGTMWHEITVIYWDIVRTLVEADVLPNEVGASFRRALEGMTIERTEDGFVVAHFLSDRMVSESLEATMPHAFEEQLVAQVQASGSDLSESIQGTARETIGAIEPRLAELDGLDASARMTVRRELAAAYASVGNLEDARTQLRQAMGDAEEASDSEQRAFVAAELCELELDYGHTGRASAVIDEARESCAQSACGLAYASVSACAARVLAAKGQLEDALTLLDEDAERLGGYASTASMSDAAVELLIEADRAPDAAAAARAFRFGRGTLANPSQLFALEALALARTPAPLDRVQARISMSLAYRPAPASVRSSEESDVFIARIECVARGSREPGAADTRESCEAAIARSVEVHGENHPETVRARLAYARALTAARDRQRAEAQLRSIDAALATLGPDSLLRRERSALTTSARRPR